MATLGWLTTHSKFTYSQTQNTQILFGMQEVWYVYFSLFHVYKLLYLQVCIIQPEFHVSLTTEKDVSKYKQWRNSLNIVGQILTIPTSSLSEEERVGCVRRMLMTCEVLLITISIWL